MLQIADLEALLTACSGWYLSRCMEPSPTFEPLALHHARTARSGARMIVCRLSTLHHTQMEGYSVTQTSMLEMYLRAYEIGCHVSVTRTYASPADWKMLCSTIQNRPRVARRTFLHKCYVALCETGLCDSWGQKIWNILIHKPLRNA